MRMGTSQIGSSVTLECKRAVKLIAHKLKIETATRSPEAVPLRDAVPLVVVVATAWGKIVSDPTNLMLLCPFESDSIQMRRARKQLV
jgi:hypothetical protein